MNASSYIAIWIATFNWTTFVRRLGGPGLFLLGILDGSLVPTLGSLDLLTGLLSARNHGSWLYYAVMSTLGGMIGAYTTYRIGRKTGTIWLDKKIGERRSKHIQSLMEHWGFGAVFVATLAPPPFPASLFFYGAGAAKNSLQRYLSAVGVGRAVRYGAIAYITSHYHAHLLRFFRHPEKYWVQSVLISIALLAGAAMTLWIWNRWSSDTTVDLAA